MSRDVLIPGGQYSTITLRDRWINQDVQHYPYFMGHKYVNHDGRIDIYNLKLEKIAENVAEIGDLGADRLIVEQGFEGVLIDSSGKPLARRSLFTNIQGE